MTESPSFLQCRLWMLCAKVKNSRVKKGKWLLNWESLREKLIFLPRQQVNLIHLQWWELGYLKVVPILFRKGSVLSCKAFQRVIGQTSVFSAALQRLDGFRMKHIYGTSYQRLCSPVRVKSLFMVLIGYLTLSKLFA